MPGFGPLSSPKADFVSTAWLDQIPPILNRPKPSRTEPDRAGQSRTEPDRAGRNRTEPDGTGPSRRGLLARLASDRRSPLHFLLQRGNLEHFIGLVVTDDLQMLGVDRFTAVHLD